LIAGPLTDVESSLSVADVHPFGGDWLLDKISFVFLESILMEMIDVPFSLNPLAEDMTIWAFSSNGVFSLYSEPMLCPKV
jgi:ABC-type sulfate transport system permease subunit